MNRTQELSRASVVSPKSLQSLRDQATGAAKEDTDLDYYEQTHGLYSSFIGDQFPNHFQSTRNAFETWQPQQSSPRSPKSPVSGNTSPNVPNSPVTERIESFSSLKQRFENDVNNNVQHAPPKASRHSSCNLGESRESWVSYSSPNSSRRSSTSSMEPNDKHRRSSEMSIVRERIAIAKNELVEANERREVADRAYAFAKSRILSSKRTSKSLREQIRSMQDLVERKQKKTEDLTKRLGSRTIVIEENRRAAKHYDRDTQNESASVRQKIEATREKRKATVEKICSLVQRISPMQTAIVEADRKEEEARLKSRRMGDIITKLTIRLKNARALSLTTDKGTSFKGYKVEDVHKRITQQRDRLKRAKSDITYLEYRRQLLREELEESKEDVRVVLMRLNPYRRQRALGFEYTRLPMSDEL